MNIELPPPPATVQEAMRQANDLAYGFAKHTDPTYWELGVGFQGDPVYYWKRMLGWLLKEDSPDRALFGLYAFPPSPFRIPVVSLPSPPVVVPAVPLTTTIDVALFTLNTKIDSLIDVVAAADARLVAMSARLEALESLITTLTLRTPPPYTGRVFGVAVTLTPVVPT